MGLSTSLEKSEKSELTVEFSNLSAFWRLIADYGSIYARDGMQSTFVTSTFPNHYTMATGLYQESHGIVANQIYDKNAKKTINLPDDTRDNRLAYLYGGEPIWRTVEKQLGPGKSACFMWTGCQNDNLTHFVPFQSNVSWTRTVENVTDLLKTGVSLIMLYNDEPDHIGHKKGTSSNEINRMLVEIDDQMEYLMDRLEENGYLTKNTTTDENVNLIIVSDHGMLDITQYVLIKPRNELFTITIENYAYLHIDPQPGKASKTMEYLRSIPNIVVYNKSEIPEKWGYKNNDRIGQIIVVALPHFGITLKEPKS
uniref:Uncharacterized protein n=1 Tax=Romanomermis culicivorax TaxID=13658 RepID=A0A915IF18_ROMCU